MDNRTQHVQIDTQEETGGHELPLVQEMLAEDELRAEHERLFQNELPTCARTAS